MFCAAAAKEEPFSTELDASQAAQSDLILQFREQGFHLLSLEVKLAKTGHSTQNPTKGHVTPAICLHHFKLQK
jgi:hypothetical protein